MKKLENASEENGVLKKIYLNNAATSYPKPPGMAEAVYNSMQKIPLHEGRSQGGLENPLENCRILLAELFKTKFPEQIVLCKNATEALNIAILGLNLENCHVLTTCAEHNSVLRPLNYLQERGKIKLLTVPCDTEGRPSESEWRYCLDKFDPRLVVLNHASNVTGALNEPEKFFSAAKKRGSVALLDASQSAGLTDIDSEKFFSDIIAFTGHKYLLGPSGTGGFYVSKKINLKPFLSGGTGVRSDLTFMPEEMPVRLEAGTPQTDLFEGLFYSLRWARENPLDCADLERKTLKLAEGLKREGVKTVKVTGKRLCAVSFNIQGWDCLDAGYALLNGFGIVCRAGLHCAPLIHRFITDSGSGTIRFSMSRFTTDEEVDAAIESVRKIKNAHFH